MEAPGDYRKIRRDKLRCLRERGVDPYPHTFHCSHGCQEVHDRFEQLAGTEVTVAGRLRSLRLMGKVAFGHVEDASGTLQLYIRKDALGAEVYGLLKQIDLGDFLGARGKVFRTRMGEVSVQAESIMVLSKALQPMPIVKEKDGVVYDAFRDRETRYRKRYLDLMVNAETRELFRKRATTISVLRRYLDERGFLEVETPILQRIYGGGMARPFRTHHRALEMDLYLRIAEELPLKMLIVGGLDRVYEIGRVFRNEGLDRQHNPEFTLLEFYWAYADYRDGMELVEDLLRHVIRAVTGDLTLSYGGDVIDFSVPFARRTMMELIEESTGVDLVGADDATLRTLCERLGAEMPAGTPMGKRIEKIFDLAVEPKLIQPTFVIDHPKVVSPLAKSHRDQPDELVERFELFIAGMEFANAFTELNDPEEQRRRFEDQLRQREAGDDEAHPLDEDFLTALEHGMPPTAGVGIGVDRVVMLLTGAPAIRDVLLFPHMRPQSEGETDQPPSEQQTSGQKGSASRGMEP
ncbi:MAG: lysine--tRNA ligase [Candidatus Eisenbacteria sp.]|nr:lysine--tRNA ligase [Candidatus Eisenbacteria bacterium]